MDAQTTLTMRCIACGALAQASCNCGVGYEPVSPRQHAQRRREQAIELFKNGMTQQQIADKLKVSQWTISQDLRGLEETFKPPRPKGGRPKGSKAKLPGVKQAQRSINLHPDVWAQVKARAAAADMPAAEFIGQILINYIDPEINASTLPRTAQDKVAAVIRQHKRQLDSEYDQRRTNEIKEHIKRVMPNLREREDRAFRTEQVYREYMDKARKAMTVEEFTLILSLLHPDSRASASEGKLMRAFQMFKPKKFALTGEK